MSVPIQRIYLAEPHPDRVGDAFYPRWRRHAELAQGLPLWAALSDYKQLVTLPAPAGSDLAEAGCSDDFAGVCMSRIDDPDELERLKSSDSSVVILTDELEVFARPVVELAINSHIEVLKDGPWDGALLMVFFGKAAGIGQGEFTDAWRQAAHNLLERDDLGVGRLILYGGLEEEPKSKLNLVLELGFADEAALVAALRSGAIDGPAIAVTAEALRLAVDPSPVYEVPD
mgnify:CR=1 FL=1